MATDGGAKTFKGSLGVFITNSKNIVLLSYYGQDVGHDPLSFRTEASAFLFMIAEYYKEGPNKSIVTTKLITLFTDSPSILKKHTTMHKCPTAHLRCVMDPERDLLQMIHKLMAKMKERSKLGGYAVTKMMIPVLISKDYQLQQSSI